MKTYLIIDNRTTPKTVLEFGSLEALEDIAQKICKDNIGDGVDITVGMFTEYYKFYRGPKK